jgi:hypothetical protein
LDKVNKIPDLLSLEDSIFKLRLLWTVSPHLVVLLLQFVNVLVF